MTTGPQDPFSNPSGAQPEPPSSEGTASGQAPAFGESPAYGQPPAYSAAPAYASPPSAYGEETAGGRPPLASWGLRVGGYLIDVVILAAVTILVAAVAGRDFAQLVQIVLYYGLFGYLTGTSGQTPGRRVVGIKVLREADGQVLGAGMGIVRNICHILDALPLLLGFFWPLWDAKNQTFADKIVKSVVVKA